MNTPQYPHEGDHEEAGRGPRGPRGPHRGRSRSGGPSPKGERSGGPGPKRERSGGPSPRGERPSRHRRGGRGRAPRGDIRAAVLTMLTDEPMHGYQLMQAIADKSGGRWTPSPGAIYPTLNQLEDEGLVTITRESGRKLATLTDAGHEYVTARRDEWTALWSAYEGPGDGVDLRGLLQELHYATRQVGKAGTDAQRSAAAAILEDARRSLYLLLADEPKAPDA